MVKSPDIIIAGAGIIGLSVALELRRRGAQVMVLDRGEPGQEATSAAAGMLAASDPETPPALRALAMASAQLYPDYVQQIESASGMQVDFRRQGTIMLSDHELRAPFRKIEPEELKRLEPALENRGHEAFFVNESCVDPALLVRAGLAAAERAGIEARGSSEVLEITPHSDHVDVVLRTERLSALTVINCRGAWSGAPVRPRKGHSLYVQPKTAGLLEHVVVSPGVYLVPRSSGKILIGATVEDVGYDKAIHPDIIDKLRSDACRLAPQLALAPVIASWTGLRPGSPDDLPLLGNTEAPGVFVASGHFRNGILLAPITARILADLVGGKSPLWDISAFSPSRFTADPALAAKSQRARGNS